MHGINKLHRQRSETIGSHTILCYLGFCGYFWAI